MTYFRRATTSLACLILVAGCDRASSPTPDKPKAAQDQIDADIDRIQTDIRIAAANKRIDELTRQVGALQSTPDKLDLELLTSRVEALEAKIYGAASSPDMPAEKSTSDSGQPSRSVSRPSDTRQTKPQKPSKLSLPELENRTRVATLDRAK
ncbi:hypothetical protein U1737_06545 [Sphingomonas sp. LB3N6]|uniref:hypothetical protein n=1 Tax=Sphingomonas fucosidasi TaxID=3096164 RepID=UPI002FC9DB3D